MPTDKTRVYLWFMDYGEEAAVVTRLIGLELTYVCIPGQSNAQFPKMTHRVHRWKLVSPLDSSAPLNDHVEALLHLLEPHATAIKTASKIWKCGINAAVEYQDWTPGIHFTRNAQNAPLLAAGMNECSGEAAGENVTISEFPILLPLGEGG